MAHSLDNKRVNRRIFKFIYDKYIKQNSSVKIF